MEIKVGISKEKIRKISANILGKMPNVWDKSYKVIFAAFFMVCVAFAIYIWQQSTSNAAGWSEENKMEVLNAQENSSVIFKQGDFNQAVKNLKERDESYNYEFKVKKDIFAPYK